MTRVAALDCGTNSLRLLVADVASGQLTDVERRMEIVRLGQGVDRTGMLAPPAIERTRVALAGYAGSIERLGAERVRMVATSATRDASNRADFDRMVRATLGRPAEVISGDAEAALSFAGAVHGLERVGPHLVIDIGGGSTEFVLGSTTVDRALSVDVGCVRLTERHLRGDPPTYGEIASAESDVRMAIDRVRAVVPVHRARTVVGLAGSVTTVAAVAMRLPTYDAGRIHGSVLPAARIREVAGRLLAMSRAQRAALAVIHPGRVDVIGAGALILRTIVDQLAVEEVVVSEHDILDGIALSLAESSRQTGGGLP
ncbi:MAG: exopolyphosphatase [Mycobacteriales bacterium]